MNTGPRHPLAASKGWVPEAGLTTIQQSLIQTLAPAFIKMLRPFTQGYGKIFNLTIKVLEQRTSGLTWLLLTMYDIT